MAFDPYENKYERLIADAEASYKAGKISLGQYEEMKKRYHPNSIINPYTRDYIDQTYSKKHPGIVIIAPEGENMFDHIKL